MNKRIRYIILTIAFFSLIIGCIGIFPGFMTGLGFDLRIPDSFEMPLGRLKGIAVDSEGNIYCGLQFYSRIQVYDAEGRYIYGKFIYSAGGSFRIRMNDKDQLEVATARNNKLYVFEKDGTLVDEDSGRYFGYFGEVGETRFHDKSTNTTYIIRRSLLCPYVVKKNLSEQDSIIIRTPFPKCLFAGPFTAGLFLVISSIMFKIVRKNPFMFSWGIFSNKKRKI